MTIRVTGAKETGDAIIKIANDLSSKTGPEILLDVAELFISKAQSNAPVDTGFLRDNIKITEKTADRVVVTSEAEYSIYVEEGTSKMGSQPFMQPALAETERESTAMAQKKVIALMKYYIH